MKRQLLLLSLTAMGMYAEQAPYAEITFTGKIQGNPRLGNSAEPFPLSYFEIKFKGNPELLEKRYNNLSARWALFTQFSEPLPHKVTDYNSLLAKLQAIKDRFTAIEPVTQITMNLAMNEKSITVGLQDKADKTQLEITVPTQEAITMAKSIDEKK